MSEEVEGDVTSRYSFADHVTVRSTSSELKMLFDRKRGVMYELNDTASSIVQRLEDAEMNVEAIVASLQDEYDAPEAELREDVEAFLCDFTDAGLIVVVRSETP